MNEQDENKLIAERRSKLASLREEGNPFVNDFKPKDLAQNQIGRASCRERV